MDWKNRMNEAIDYIEDHLTGEIDYDTLTRIALCSEYEFRRMFSLLTKISVSEYIRFRRLTLAAEDIRKGERLIEIAGKYQYESQAAFSRAFKKFHGVTASSAKKEGMVLKYFPRFQFKVLVTEEKNMGNEKESRTNIIGAGEVSFAVSIDADSESIHNINHEFWDEIGNEAIGCTALPMYGAFISEEKCHLLGDLKGKKVLDLCCGTGRSMEYISKKQPDELWGLDLSDQQIEKSKQYLQEKKIDAKLICSPMESECGIPKEYFDTIYSVYGIGWATDLLGTFRRVYSYLKEDGVFIFSWSHPIHKCVAYNHDLLLFKKSYFDESWYSINLQGCKVCLTDRKLSTYINTLAKAGFVIEELVEESDEVLIGRNPEDHYAKKASMLPVTFVIKARKH